MKTKPTGIGDTIHSIMFDQPTTARFGNITRRTVGIDDRSFDANGRILSETFKGAANGLLRAAEISKAADFSIADFFREAASETLSGDAKAFAEVACIPAETVTIGVIGDKTWTTSASFVSMVAASVIAMNDQQNEGN